MGIGLAADDLIVRLPLPLAQLYRRALNAKTPLDRHHNAFYLAEASLKLAACLRIGIVLSRKIDLPEPLARSLEALCLPAIGHYVSFLRDVNEHLHRRADAALLPLADVAGKLAQSQPLPAVKAFAERATRVDGDEHPPLTAEQIRDSGRHGVLGFFTLVAAYRNQVFGHGAQRPAAYYEEVGPLLLEATAEVLRLPILFGGLRLAVPRLEMSATGREATVVWQGLMGPVSLPLAAELAAAGAEAGRPEPGHLHFVEPGVRIPLHPLVVYHEDRTGRERVGFLNRAVTRKVGAADEVRRCEYLDYATGDPLRDIDARQELTRLLATLRGQDVTPAEVDRVIAASRAEAEETAPSETMAPGAVIGDFELEGELGRGGMGVVYRARQRSLNRKVALKVLPPALAADSVALARFRRETAALARCDHPNMVKILTSGVDGDRHFYAMELVEGTDLADLFAVLSSWSKSSRQTLHAGVLPTAISSSCDLARRRRAESESTTEPPTHADAHTAVERPIPTGSLPALAPIPATPPPLSDGPALSVRMGELFGDVADALAHLHERGILHRDIKPANLMLTADGRRLVLMDLGLARLEGEAADRMTRTRQFLGTLRYASPEQVHSATAVDVRSDVYSLGATLWEMLALQPIHGAEVGLNDPELVRRIQFEEPGRIRKRHPEVPEELEAIALQCVEKNPWRRFATARDLADDLARWRRGEPIRARRMTAAYRLRRFVRRRRRPLVVAGMIFALFAIGYVALADGGARVVGGETLRRFLDRHEMSMLRPAPTETAIRQTASELRGFVGQKLLGASVLRPGWWSAVLQLPAGEKPAFDAWTQAQTTAALELAPETPAADREMLAGSLLEMFDGWEGQVKGFEPGYGFQLFRLKTTRHPYPSAIGTSWMLPAVAAALANPNLSEGRREKLEKRLRHLQAALDRHQVVKDDQPIGAWRMYVNQDDSSAASIYITATMFLGLLEAKKANLAWRGDRARLEKLLNDVEAYVVSQFDGRGWKCGGATGRLEFNDGLTLWLFALLMRAEAEDGLVLPDAIAARIPRHLADCGTRSADYPISVNEISQPFSYGGNDYAEETRNVRLLWHPWATEAASLWLERCKRRGEPLDEIVRARRVLGHLVIDFAPTIRSEATTGQTFIPTETLIGLSAVPPP